MDAPRLPAIVAKTGSLVVQIQIIVPADRSVYTLACVIDTGFTGSLGLSQGIIDKLSLPAWGQGDVHYANGDSEMQTIYQATVLTESGDRVVGVRRSHLNIVGLSFLRGYSMLTTFLPGSEVYLIRTGDFLDAKTEIQCKWDTWGRLYQPDDIQPPDESIQTE